MKTFVTLALAASVILLAPPAEAQTRSRSERVDLANGMYSVVYLNDGQTGSAGIVFNDLGVKLPVAGLSLSTMLVNTTGSDARSYVGSYLAYKVYEAKGYRFDVGIGVKGLDVTSFVSGKANVSGLTFNAPNPIVFGVSAKIPVRF